MAVRALTPLEISVCKQGLALLIASQRRSINTSVSERMRKASEDSLAESKAVELAFTNQELGL